MKANKIFATAAALAAMFTMNATEAMADMYHAKKVECRMGISEDKVELTKLGVTKDSCEIWGEMNTTDNYAYFWCNIDGNDFSVPATSIEGNQAHTLVDLSWYQYPLARCIESGVNQTLFVKVKSNKSGDNKFVSWNREDEIPNQEEWYIDASVTMEPVGNPVYNAESDTYTQNINWEKHNISNWVFCQAVIYASFDECQTWKPVGLTSFEEGIQKTITVTLPGNSKNVYYGLEVKPHPAYAMIAPDGVWTTPPSKCFELNKQSNARVKAMSDDDESATAGIQGIENADNANAQADVYTVSGVRVAQGTTISQASESLPRGIYVVNGKKMLLGK